jgi:hypothetical protein
MRASLLGELGGGVSVAGSYGEGIAQPTFFDLYGFFPGSFVGNPALRPEQSRGVELALRYRDEGADRISPLSIPLLMANAASGVVAMRHDLRGQSFGTVSACAAGAHAIGMAERLIRYGDADVVVTGGSEAAITPLATAAFAQRYGPIPAQYQRMADLCAAPAVGLVGAAESFRASGRHRRFKGGGLRFWSRHSFSRH